MLPNRVPFYPHFDPQPPYFKKALKTGHCHQTATGFAKPLEPNATLDTLASPADDVRHP